MFGSCQPRVTDVIVMFSGNKGTTKMLEGMTFTIGEINVCICTAHDCAHTVCVMPEILGFNIKFSTELIKRCQNYVMRSFCTVTYFDFQNRS